MFRQLLVIAVICLVAKTVLSFIPATTRQCRISKFVIAAEKFEDPNFDAHLAKFLKVGRNPERPDPDLGKNLRSRFSKMKSLKRDAAAALKKSNNIELAIELEELADEFAETEERFVEAALFYDAWNRPSPDLPTQLRDKATYTGRFGSDPNYEAHLPDMMKKGLDGDRASPGLPSKLRLLKYKNMAQVKRLAAQELRKSSAYSALAEELEAMADEIEESHESFVHIANTIGAQVATEGSVVKGEE